MLKRLKLTNFRKHEDVTVDFSEGLQVIRGANERGKSTLFEAVGYAFWGARALPESLEATVTWGQPVRTLKVELTFIHEDVTYTVTRAKSGAELTSSAGVTASGHAEVTAFIERLFRASAQVGMATLLVSQGALKSSLESSSISLIEKLSNMGLIDELVKRIQDNLPCGNTKLLDQNLAQLEQAKPPVLDYADLPQRLEAAVADLQQATAELGEVKLRAQHTAQYAKEAETRIAAAKKAEQDRARLQREIAALVPIPVPPAPAQTADNLQKLQEAQRAAKEKLSAKAAFDKVDKPSQVMPAELFAVEWTEVNQKQSAASQRKLQIVSEIAKLETLLVTSTHCGLCDKDLSNVPEVVAKNAQLQAKIEALKAEKLSIEALTETTSKRILELTAIQKQADKLKALHIPFTTVNFAVMPPALVWVGGEVPELDAVDYSAEIRKVIAEQSAHDTAVARNSMATEQREQKEAELAAIPELPIADSDLDWVALHKAMPSMVEEATKKVNSLTFLKDQIANQIGLLEATYKAQQEAYEAVQMQKAKLRSDIALYQFHNTIIDKLRSARPIVAKKLWGTVLAGVSHYLTLIRGRPSTVSRTDDGFLIDAKSVASYSGSTKDSLGLAIRIMLQKTFLGSVDLMLLDEVAAACDDTRESDMLGVLSSCGIRQVVLVTHSDLADAFAANVITL